jgi:hypothetical protein
MLARQFEEKRLAASGKPVVVQNTGPSSFLPDGEGMFRFSTLDEAANALAVINSDYARHCRAAREIVEAHFDSRKTLEGIMNLALGGILRKEGAGAAPATHSQGDPTCHWPGLHHGPSSESM